MSPRSSPSTQQEHFREGHDLDFSYVSEDGGRFRVNVFRKETGVGATFRSIPSEIPEHRAPGAAADRQEAVRLPPGHDPGHGLHRHRQVDHAGLDDRPAELDAAAEHHQPRGPDRVRPPQQEQPGDPARAGHAPALLRRGRARRDARGPGRDPGRRAARRRDHLDGDDRGGDRPPGARHPAHDQRREDHRPHHRCAAGRGARADQELPVAEPDRGDHPGAGQERRRRAAARRSAK